MATKTLYATMTPLPGHEAFVKDALSKMAADVRKEPGCVRFEVYELENGQLHVEETYKDEDAFKAHINTEHGKKFNQSIIGKVEGNGSTVVFLKSVDTTL